jgi:hypothetical protein
MFAGWIFEENLRPFLAALAWAFTVDFDADDWLAISHGIKATNTDREQWFKYEFNGEGGTLKFAVARDAGGGVFSIRVQSQKHGDILGAIIMMCQ